MTPSDVDGVREFPGLPSEKDPVSESTIRGPVVATQEKGDETPVPWVTLPSCQTYDPEADVPLSTGVPREVGEVEVVTEERIVESLSE